MGKMENKLDTRTYLCKHCGMGQVHHPDARCYTCRWEDKCEREERAAKGERERP